MRQLFRERIDSASSDGQFGMHAVRYAIETGLRSSGSREFMYEEESPQYSDLRKHWFVICEHNALALNYEKRFQDFVDEFCVFYRRVVKVARNMFIFSHRGSPTFIFLLLICKRSFNNCNCFKRWSDMV